METTLLITILIFVAVAIVLQFVFRNKGNNDIPQLLTKVNELQSGLTKIESNLKEDFRINREENTANAKTNREELNKAIADFRTEIMTAVKTMTEQNNTALEKLNQTLEQKVTALIDKNDKSFKAFTDGNTVQLEKIEKKVEENLKALTEQAKVDNNLMRDALVKAFKDFQESFDKNVKSFNDLQREKFGQLETKQNELVQGTEKKLETIRITTEKIFKDFSEANTTQLEKIEKQVETKLQSLTEQAKTDNLQMRETLANAIQGFQDTFDKNVKSFNDLQREKFGQLETKQNELVQGTEKKLESIRVTVEEKLEKTLSERLGQSFETVGKQLIEVQKGLGEMQTIATDVGGLKKVLSNVKLRGGVGEVQLALLLEQILAPNQYDANVRTKKGSTEPVEFAIKLPGRSEDESAFVYLPIDAKFPKDTYEHLLAAYESAIPEDIEAATKNLETVIKKMAKDIRDKYLDPPNTTDFAIMFLPFESIYAEVIRRSSLIDQLRTEFQITVAGPTTLMAILNSLQMGFRTLALQKRSSEVWKVLGTVKSEFEKFGGLLEKAQKNIQTGLGQLDDVVGTRTRAIQRQLRNVESLPAVEAQNLLTDVALDALDIETENQG